MKYAFFIPVCFLLCCKSKPEPRPTNILSQSQFAMVMIDVQLAEAMKTQKVFVTLQRPSNAPVLYDRLLQKHNISRNDFERTFEYYKQRPREFEGVYEQVLDSLSKLEVRVKQSYSRKLRAESDSIFTASKARRDSLRRQKRKK